MTSSSHAVVGIDVGGCGKGFHAVALRDGQFVAKHFTAAGEVAAWCQKQNAEAIAIDAPCAWAKSGRSRLAERSLSVSGETIQCFKTPTRISAKGRAFYGWVFNGETLYQSLFPKYRLHGENRQRSKVVLETFPHAIVCALAGRVIPAQAKATVRRRILREENYDDGPLANIDFVDAALCAVTAERYLLGRTQSFGDAEEGFIVVPDTATQARAKGFS